MTRFIKQLIAPARLWLAAGVLGFSLVAFAGMPVSAQGTAKEDVCAGVNLDNAGGCASGGTELQTVIRAVIQILSLIGGIAAIIMLIIGGIKYVTSGGDSSSIASAKTTIIYAIVGLIIVALAQVIVRFVLGRATNP